MLTKKQYSDEEIEQMLESKIRASHLEKVIQYLHTKIEEIKYERDKLSVDLIDKIDELKIKSKKLEDKINENEEITEELFALQSQFEKLKKLVPITNE